ncbi:MAG: glycine/sarcosine/betaine reductase selenoprotein B family protein [Acidimicrobiia bacterium]|nr:glycine/sarcosine/betaine reductase selenoprotein B family protein [Acidimicrobiia bacterium]
MTESFAEFRESFSYGTRSDLSFKFLKSLPDAEAAEFLRRLLEEVGETYDTGDIAAIIDLAIDAQIAGYRPDPDRPSRWTYTDRPFAPLTKPLAESRVGLLTSSGHFAEGDDPKPFGVPNMTQQEAEDRISEFLREAPILSVIPRDLPANKLRVRHGGYDTRSTLRDHNVSFPRDALLSARDSGRIGDISERLYSFPGATAQGRIKQLAPDWAGQMHEDEIDVLLLVPV